jgi:hypothetical protein
MSDMNFPVINTLRADKRTLTEVTVDDLRRLARLAEQCYQLEPIARTAMKSDPALRMAMYTMIQAMSNLQLKYHTKAQKRLKRPYFTLTLPMTILIAAHLLCQKSELLEQWEATDLLRLIDKYI